MPGAGRLTNTQYALRPGALNWRGHRRGFFLAVPGLCSKKWSFLDAVKCTTSTTIALGLVEGGRTTREAIFVEDGPNPDI